VLAIALLATYNEERFIEPCLQHLIGQGLAVYLIDNSSSDRTPELAERYLGRGLIGIETARRDDSYRWKPILARKEQLATGLDADWFMHVDADEIRVPPSTGTTLVEAFSEADRRGFNAVDFQEFTFVPTREAPDHDHPRFYETMRRYYPFRPQPLCQLKAWKRQARVDLVSSGGHRADFPGLRVFPEVFPMRHYLFLSIGHAIRKYVERRYDPGEVEEGLHRARAALRPEAIALLSDDELRLHITDDQLDGSDPWTRHALFSAT
jgi:glycosyltransferase involved in cell wall biosynthesis